VAGLARTLGGLHFGAEVLASARALALQRRFDLCELGSQLGLDLLRTVECAVHAAELGGEEGCR